MEKKDLTIRKRKKTNIFIRLFLNQMTPTILLVLIQIAVFVLFLINIFENFYSYYLLNLAISIILIATILKRDTDQSYKIAWIVIVSILPIFGSLLYLWVRIMPAAHSISKKLVRRMQETSSYMKQDETVQEEIRQNYFEYAGVVNYLHNYGPFPTYRNQAATYYPLGDDVYPDMIKALEGAKKFIFLEYFIIAPGIMWNSIVTILKQKVQEGVEVRLLYDGLNSLTTIPRNYYKKIRATGIQCRVFSPLSSTLSPYQNSRDHRKMMIIDGQIGFIGGINLADEYINQLNRFGHWKDTALRFRGEAVNSLTISFLSMWHIYDKVPMIVEPYLHNPNDFQVAAKNESATGFITPYADAPEDGEERGERLFLDQISDAKHYVHIYTPYLVMNEALKKAITAAQKRGVEVVIIMPHHPDKKIPFWVARTYYAALIKIGIKIYEYTPGFMHGKLVISDDKIINIGSINFDFRSLYLNYENGALIFDAEIAKKVEQDYQQTIAKSELITLKRCRKFPWFERLIGFIMSFFDPLF